MDNEGFFSSSREFKVLNKRVSYNKNGEMGSG
jgi:hypothetical protein